jgi:hypothetical protein
MDALTRQQTVVLAEGTSLRRPLLLLLLLLLLFAQL